MCVCVYVYAEIRASFDLNSGCQLRKKYVMELGREEDLCLTVHFVDSYLISPCDIFLPSFCVSDVLSLRPSGLVFFLFSLTLHLSNCL